MLLWIGIMGAIIAQGEPSLPELQIWFEGSVSWVTGIHWTEY